MVGTGLIQERKGPMGLRRSTEEMSKKMVEVEKYRESGMNVDEACKKAGVSACSYYTRRTRQRQNPGKFGMPKRAAKSIAPPRAEIFQAEDGPLSSEKVLLNVIRGQLKGILELVYDLDKQIR